jgi:hypothetical protein
MERQTEFNGRSTTKHAPTSFAICLQKILMYFVCVTSLDENFSQPHFQGERMYGISDNTTVILRPNPPQILTIYRRMTDRLHGSSDFYI